MRTRTPTSALLEKVEKHIDRLDRALRESEDLLKSLKRTDREDWIRALHERLVSEPPHPFLQGEGNRDHSAGSTAPASWPWARCPRPAAASCWRRRSNNLAV